MAQDVDDIVRNGLCVGCGLCQSIAGENKLKMTMTAAGRLRPSLIQPLPAEITTRIYSVCPGVRVEGLESRNNDPDFATDPIWGQSARLSIGYAADPHVRFKASTGGALSALCIYLLESGRVDFILHVAASKAQPMRSERHLSFDRSQVLEGAGSRYGPAAPLVDFCQLLDLERPFAFVGKPCDVAAVRNLAKIDPRIDKYVRYLLSPVCGGASELTLSHNIIARFGLEEAEVGLLRYRGNGNPGPTRIETKDGRTFEASYNEVWGDEAGWQLQARCKICPDAIGEQADIAVSDVWPGGSPQGEDAGFNGFIARTHKGLELLEQAERANAVCLERPMSFRDLDLFQPHQVRKKQAVAARVLGMLLAGQMLPRFRRLRLLRSAWDAGLRHNLRNCLGMFRRSRQGKTREPAA